MAITYVDPDEGRRQRLALLLQGFKQASDAALIPSQIEKAKQEAAVYKSLVLPPSPSPGQSAPLPVLPSGSFTQPLNFANLVQGGGLPLALSSLTKSGPTFSLDPIAKVYAEKAAGSLVKRQEDTQERIDSAQRTATQTGRYLQQYQRSLDELTKRFPEIGQDGLSGWFTRQGGQLLKNLDEFPETKALEKISKPFAQQLATEIEGRATDEDRRIQVEAFANVLTAPTATNIRLASHQLLTLLDKGADISKVLDTLESSGHDVMLKIVEQVREGAPETARTVNVDDLLAKWSK
jgi:hypothetical protein